MARPPILDVLRWCGRNGITCLTLRYGKGETSNYIEAEIDSGQVLVFENDTQLYKRFNKP
jgi:hypothetical protein